MKTRTRTLTLNLLVLALCAALHAGCIQEDVDVDGDLGDELGEVGVTAQGLTVTPYREDPGNTRMASTLRALDPDDGTAEIDVCFCHANGTGAECELETCDNLKVGVPHGCTFVAGASCDGSVDECFDWFCN